MSRTMSPRERLVYHVLQELERLAQLKAQAAEDFRAGLALATAAGYDGTTLKAVLKLRKMSPTQRSERRALEAIYLAALGMLEGDALPEEARRRLDGRNEPNQTRTPEAPALPAPDASAPESAPNVPEQPPLILKEPAEARQEGADAAAVGKRIYDNPYRASDPCRAAWDEGWGRWRSGGGSSS